ncbi:extracellular solute-binding protein [Paenibacillus silagei]|uniref:Multiple sugar transport system substrate-binding protein n=1 Tax=Paenibacillus silagei TaxID=1670801 RepID=A0ABS4NKW5_9BACL|nr:extracellular solute-binding protein [Paenibacillus silagei]MBP2110683.1 multiple sugar transport system substrate-binding protein [Paenibacillus silagei]
MKLILPVLLLCLLLFTGCADFSSRHTEPPERSTPVTISFWNPFGGGEGEFVERIIHDYNASQSEVFVKQLRLESNEYYARLRTALSFGKGPDVAVIHADRLSPFIKAQQIIPLNALAQQGGFQFNQIGEQNLQSVSYAGQYYAVPLDTHFHMLYYNKAILAKAGILSADGTPLLEETTPEGFIRLLRQIAARVPGVQPMAVNTPYFQESFLDLYYQAGGELLSRDGKRAAIYNEKSVEVLSFYQRLFDEGLSDLSDNTPWDSFDKGQAGLWFGGVWEAGHHLDNKALDIGIIPLPPIFGSADHWGSSHTLVIPAYTTVERQAGALDFMKYFSEVGGMIWGEAGHVPANSTVEQSRMYRELPYRERFIQAKDQVKFAPQTDKYAALFTAMSEELQHIVRNRIQPEAGLKRLEESLNQILAN